MSSPNVSSQGQPMANYAAARRVGEFVFLSGVVAVDPARGQVLQRYAARIGHWGHSFSRWCVRRGHFHSPRKS